MLTLEQKRQFGIMKAEVINLNILAHCFVRKINRWNYLWAETTRHFIFEELTALRYMENGLILHLTKLDDDDDKFSFRAAGKELKTTIKDQAKLKKFHELLKEYRQGLNSFKNQHRNKRIAHLNEHDEMELMQFLNFEIAFKPLIEKANAIGDLIWGAKINYGFELGRPDPTLDFRELTKDLKVDLRKERRW